MGGLGWYDLEVEVGISHLERFIHGLNENIQLGKITQVAITNWFWAIGFSPFKTLVPRIVHDETVWVKKVNYFTQENIIQVNCPIKCEPLLREGDKYMMKQAYKLGLSDAKIKYVNYCCLFLDVILLGDISDEDGSCIVNEAWIRKKAIKLS